MRLLSLGMLLWVAAAVAQQSGSAGAPPPSTMEMTIVGMSLKASDGKIYVNQNCEVFPGLQLPVSRRTKGESMPEVCHLENVEESERRDEKAGEPKVKVREQEYVLQNIGEKAEVFEVLEQVPEGWSVDSDPKPLKIEGAVAIFEVHAGPWETVRLHVGLRHTKK